MTEPTPMVRVDLDTDAELYPALSAHRVTATRWTRHRVVPADVWDRYEQARTALRAAEDELVRTAGPVQVAPGCCRCDPDRCSDDGQHCAERGCDWCMEGCPAPARCCWLEPPRA